MRCFQHSGTNAVVSVNDNGHKTIRKYGIDFRTFADLKKFEYKLMRERRAIVSSKWEDREELVEKKESVKSKRAEYAKYKGEW